MKVIKAIGKQSLLTLWLIFGLMMLVGRLNADPIDLTPAIVGCTQNGTGSVQLVVACNVVVEPPKGYQPFMHLTDPSTPSVPQLSTPDPGLPADASTWPVGGTITGKMCTVTLPPGSHDGTYEIKFGIYNPTTGDRLILRGNNDGSNRFILGTLVVSDGGKSILMPGVPPLTPTLTGQYRVVASAGHFVQTGPRAFNIVFGWLVRDKIPDGYIVFVHIVNLTPGIPNDVATQAGSGISALPSDWPVGFKTLSDPVSVSLAGVPDGKYDIRVGLWKYKGDGSRLKLVGSNDDGSNRYTVGSVFVSDNGATLTFIRATGN